MNAHRKQRPHPWQHVHRWQYRVGLQPHRGMGGIRLFFTWLALGLLIVIGLTLGLVFMLLSWLLLPVLRHVLKRRFQHMQESGSAPANDPFTNMPRRHSRQQETLEGDYTVESRDRPEK